MRWLLQICRGLYRVYEEYMEDRFAKKILAGKRTIAHYKFFQRFRLLIMKEIDLGRIRGSDSLLFIGSGSFPVSAILYATISGCMVACVEKDPDRVRLSRMVIRALQLDKQITIMHNYGEYVPTQCFTVVIIAALAQPKEAIIRNVLEQNGFALRILVRTTFGFRKLFYESTDDIPMSARCSPAKSIASGRELISTLLIPPSDHSESPEVVT